MGHYAYLPTLSGRFEVIDVSDPVFPWGVGGIQTTASWLHSVAKSGSHAYLLAVYNYNVGDAALMAIDIRDPADPRVIGEARFATGVAGPRNIGVTGKCVALSGNYAFVAVSDGGLQVIDICDPANPQHVGGFASSDARGVAVANGYAYVADARDGLRVIDISAYSSAAPELVITRQPDRRVFLTWQHPSGSPDYLLQECPDPNSGDWTEVTVTTPGRYEVTDPAGATFYRLLEP
jgi:hypothetical protein